MLKAIIFDFDGTIADTISALCEGINRTMRQYGFPEHTYDDILRFVNHGARELVRKALPEEWRDNAPFVDQALRLYNEEYGEVYTKTDRAYDGVAELIADLHDAGFAIGVLSNKQDFFVKRLTEQVLIPGSYDVAQGVISGQPTKPDPYLSRKIASSLGVTPEECAMVGDSDVDIETAKNAGMIHIGVSWGFREETFLRAHGAEHIAHTPLEIAQIVRRLNGQEVL